MQRMTIDPDTGDLAILQLDDTVGHLGDLHVMRDHDDSLTPFSDDVLDKGLLKRLFVSQIAYDRRNDRKARLARCTPSALTCYYPVSVSPLLNDYGLNYAALSDRCCKLIDLLIVKVLSGLIFVR